MPRRLDPSPRATPVPPSDLQAGPMRRALLGWYDEVGRALPFRGATDPWAILVSEAMAQQTQAARAGEAWRTFMASYPTPAALAAVSPAEVLRAWRGLGYNRRAVALRAAAVAIVEEHEGQVPSDPGVLERLPGVGPYTARAVAAIAFGRPVAAVDTNVRRVLTRLVGASQSATPRALQAAADALVDPDRPGDWTHALMDVGATVCRGARPDCPACPLDPWCATAARLRSGPLNGDPNVVTERGDSSDAFTRRERRAAETLAPYRSTSRWLRGRIVERLRDASDGEWVRLDVSDGDWVRLEGMPGQHDPQAIAASIAALEHDGLVERHPSDPGLVRLPTLASDVRERAVG